MAIKYLEIKNFRVLRDVNLRDIPSLVIILGANGTGKSTLFDVFSFLKDALSGSVSSAVDKRGGFEGLVSRGESGPIKITVQFRQKSGRLATYILEIASHGDRVVVAREILRYRRGRHGKPWHFVDFSYGKGYAITNESVYGEEGAVQNREEYELDDPSILAIKGLGQFREFRVVSEFRNLIENWYISNFQINDARPSSEFGYAEHLSTRGDNIAQVTQYLYKNHRDRFEQVLNAMSSRVPGVRNVEAKPMEDGRLVLRFQDGSFEDPFIAKYVSDGTIKMFAYLVLLHEPKSHPLLAIEEPENQLYLSLFGELVEEFRAYARGGGQVFISTHSSDFIRNADLHEVYWFEKRDGFSHIRRASEDAQLQNFIEEGDSLSELWRQGMFGECDPS